MRSKQLYLTPAPPAPPGVDVEPGADVPGAGVGVPAGGVVGDVGDVVGVPGRVVRGGVAGVAGLVPAGPRVVPGAHGAIPLAVALALGEMDPLAPTEPIDVVAVVPDCAVVPGVVADGVVDEGEVVPAVPTAAPAVPVVPVVAVVPVVDVDGVADAFVPGDVDAAAIGMHGMSTGLLLPGEPGVPGIVVPGVPGVAGVAGVDVAGVPGAPVAGVCADGLTSIMVAPMIATPVM